MNITVSLRAIVLGLACFCLLLSWLLPSHFRPWPLAYQELLAAVALLLAGLVALTGRRNRIPAASLLIGCLASIPVLQLSAGILSFAGDAWLSSSYILVLALAVFIGYNLQLTEPEQLGAVFAERLAWTLLLGAAVSGVLAVMQWLGFTDSFWISSTSNPARPVANLAQPNNLATLLGMGLVSLLYLFELHRVPRLVAVLLVLSLLFVLALTQSRTPWLTALLIGGFWLWQHRDLKLRLTAQPMLLWLLIYMGMVVSVPLLTQYLGIGSGSLMDRVQQITRLGLYQQFTAALLEGPWYGYGWGQVFVAQATVAVSQPGNAPSFYTHNVLLDLLIWNGPVVGGLIILLTGMWFWYLLKNARNLTSTYAWLVIACFVVHSMLEYPHAYLVLLVPVGLMLGVLQASVVVAGRSCALPRIVLVAVLGLSALLTAVMWRDYQLVELEYNVAVLEDNADFVPTQEQPITQAYTLTHMREYIYFIRAPIKNGYSEPQLDEMLAIIERFPHFYFLLKGAYILTINDQVEKAHELLTLMEGLHQRPGLEHALAYLGEMVEENPDLLELLEGFGVLPSSQAEPSAT